MWFCKSNYNLLFDFVGWILKVCPYYEILDEVMGCRPNVTPPAVIFTSEFSNENVYNRGRDGIVVEDEDELLDVEPEASKVLS